MITRNETTICNVMWLHVLRQQFQVHCKHCKVKVRLNTLISFTLFFCIAWSMSCWTWRELISPVMLSHVLEGLCKWGWTGFVNFDVQNPRSLIQTNIRNREWTWIGAWYFVELTLSRPTRSTLPGQGVCAPLLPPPPAHTALVMSTRFISVFTNIR